MKHVLTTSSAHQTQLIAMKFGSLVKPGMVILLSGDLGAGKTCFTQGLGKAMGISKTISSPTFTIMKVYHGRLPLYHIDAYRLEHSFQDIGFDEVINGDGVCVIEWPDFVSPLLPREYLKLEIKWIEENVRDLIFEAVGQQYESLLSEVLCTF
jgi:tRNA threonylcarbamoyladenosine biosynthesis protein TsaE